MVAAIDEEGENLDSSILGGRSGVLDRHRCDGRLVQPSTEVVRVSCGVANFEERHRGDAYKAALDPVSPSVNLGACSESDQSRLVNQPVRVLGHDHARRTTSGSSRSEKRMANR